MLTPSLLYSSLFLKFLNVVSFLQQLVQFLLLFFLQPPPKPDDKRRPATSRVKVKIFPYLFRSKLAADMFPYNVQVSILKHS